MSAILANRPSIDSESEMLPTDPPAWIVRSTARILIAVFGLALLASVVVHFPETSTSDFVLVPKSGADPIQSPRLATIEKVNVTEGQLVKKNDEMFMLQSDEIHAWDTEMRTIMEDLRTKQENAEKLTAAYASEIEMKAAEVAQAESELTFRNKHTQSSRELLSRLEKLSKTGGISQIDLAKLQIDSAESEKDQSVAQRTLQQVQLQKQQMENEQQRKRSEATADIEKLKFRLNALKSSLQNSQSNVLAIRAPYDGTVVAVTHQNAGSVVQNGQELCQLARTDMEPVARLNVQESALARLQVGQKVRFFLEAYPYQRYGAINGKVDWISPSVVTSTEGTKFVALASIDKSSVKARIGLRVGMKGEAHVVVGRRTLIEYAFEPIKQLRESVRD